MSVSGSSSFGLEILVEENDVSSSEESEIHDIKVDYNLLSIDDILFCYRKPYDIKCLGEIELSRSSLLTDPFFNFQLIENIDLQTILYSKKGEEIYDNIGVKRYRDLCQKYRTFNVKKFEKMLHTASIDLTYFGLSTKGARAVFETLTHNEFVEYFNVSCSYFAANVGNYIREMLSLNKTLKVLILRECRLKEGVIFLVEGLKDNKTLTELDLSYNYMGDEAVIKLMKVLQVNNTLEVLNLAHNLLTSNCGEAVGKTLELNYSIRDLDLSWNTINDMSGTKFLFEGIRENRKGALKSLKMSWNGLTGISGGGPLGMCIKCNKGLNYLDLQYNCLNGKALEFLLAGIKESHTLKELILTNIPYKIEELNLLIETFASSRKFSLKVLDLSSHYLDKINKPIIEKLTHWGKVVKFAGYLSDFILLGPDCEMVVLERCKALAEGGKKKKKKGQEPQPFGIFFHDITQSLMSRGDFREFISSWKIKKIEDDYSLMKEIVTTFSNETGQIRIGDMRDKFLAAYPDTPKPPRPPSNLQILETNPETVTETVSDKKSAAKKKKKK